MLEAVHVLAPPAPVLACPAQEAAQEAAQAFLAWLHGHPAPCTELELPAPDPAPAGDPVRAILRAARIPRPLRLAPGERWCRACGADNQVGHDECIRCDSHDLVDPRAILRPGEYVEVAGAGAVEHLPIGRPALYRGG